jgi:hypothetical protein
LGFRNPTSRASGVLGVKGVRVRVCLAVVGEHGGWLRPF